MLTKLALGLALLGSHPAMTEDLAERAAVLYADGRPSCHVIDKRHARCIVRDRYEDENVIVLYRWRMVLELDARGHIRLGR